MKNYLLKNKFEIGNKLLHIHFIDIYAICQLLTNE